MAPIRQDGDHMIPKRLVIVFITIAAILVGMRPASRTNADTRGSVKSESDHVKWVLESFERMSSIRPGVTRKALLQVFQPESGGFSTRLGRTYVYDKCPYFKIDVQFTVTKTSDIDPSGRIGPNESPDDIVKAVSKPYLETVFPSD